MGVRGILRAAQGFWCKVKGGLGLWGPSSLSFFLALFTRFGIYQALCCALNLYWDLHYELTQTEYQPWETKYCSLGLLPLPNTLSTVYSVR